MRADQVDTLIDQLEDFITAIVRVSNTNDAADDMILDNMRTSLKEYIISLTVPKEKNINVGECPECGGKMAQRTNRQSGNIFFGCLKFPDCKGTRDENGLSKAERDAQKEVTQQDGYKFSKNRQPWNESGPS